MSTPTPDDPFAEHDNGRTFIMPTPGGRGAVPATAVPRQAVATGPDVAADIGLPESGLNALVALANPLLALVPL